jgi:hypothetical protein
MSASEGARPLCASLLAVVLHLPFVLRYDLHFQPDFAISMLMSRAIAVEGERPIFFWAQSYLGTYGCYVTALLFRLFGVSVILAGLVSLLVWACGVGLATALAARLLGGRAAWWAAVAAAVASPYANHYVTQPYTSYETAPVLSILAIGGLAWAEGQVDRPLGARTAAGWIALGLVLGLGWWTTRLFLPSLVAVALAILLGGGWRRVVVRRAAAGMVLLLAAALLGGSPELVYRIRAGPGGDDAPSFGLAKRAEISANLRQAVASLPAYFNGDPRARLPEGVSFAEGLAQGTDPRATDRVLTRIAAVVVDDVVRAALVLLLVPTVWTAVAAWRRGNRCLLALCLTPLVHLALIGLSAQTTGGYYHARRYWFASLLVFPLLLANAVVLAEGARRNTVRWAGRAVAVFLVGASLVTQARMLTLPDELADYRVLTRDLVASGERGVWMPTWNAWVVAGLSGGTIDGVSTHYNRRPEVVERVAARDHIAVVLPAGMDFPPGFRMLDSVFVRGGGPVHPAGQWWWRSYDRADHG